MRAAISIFFVICPILFHVTTASARETFGQNDPQFLINACQAAVRVYNEQNKKRFLASQRTSLADALRAGYCLGAIEQHRCWSGTAVRASTLDRARAIAALDASAISGRPSTADILRRIDCR